ncbi:DUF4376 domain-containing protein [Sphingomonas nostoxanthinifaciens]|uniref:DUF4376 domain-containing protein n=1 Tax=Sphingomonas nostoxanthinifaciens TaxID=2872652 RepID=UPI001CC21C56|nr:DUF4376 domain-containing protein [Sphingomonas nostoxanthinifaciens]UAK24175.1 DUF4376 domain-containing protein [Sphingomonas nostoxanthinifaciens]
MAQPAQLNYVLWDSALLITVRSTVVVNAAHLPPAAPNTEWVAIEGDAMTTCLAMVAGVRTEVPFALPAAVALDVARVAAWADALAYRNARQTGGCLTPLGRVDTDADSQRKISGAALAALIAKSAGQAFSIDWTMADNSVVTHDAAAMIAMGMAVTQYLDACQKAGTAKREQIEAAADEAVLASIDVTTGYPV